MLTLRYALGDKVTLRLLKLYFIADVAECSRGTVHKVASSNPVEVEQKILPAQNYNSNTVW